MLAAPNAAESQASNRVAITAGRDASSSGTPLQIARFDSLLMPAVEAALLKPATDQGGAIAWGTSYQLSALVEMFDATRDRKYVQPIIQLSDWIARSRDDRQGLQDELRGRVVAAWSSTNYTKGVRYAWAVHTGMIVAPMARFAAIVRKDPALKATWGKDADRILAVAEQSVAVHDDDYREGPEGDEGHLYCRYLKKHLPLNMQNALARAWLAISDTTGDPKYHDRARRLANFTKHRLRPMDDGSYVWSYWPPLEGKAESYEDISHAAINVDFITQCYEHGLVFTRQDLSRLEQTLLKRVLVADDRVSNTVGGGDQVNKYDESVLLWGRLGRHFPEVRQRLTVFSSRPERDSKSSALPLGIAYLTTPER